MTDFNQWTKKDISILFQVVYKAHKIDPSVVIDWDKIAEETEDMYFAIMKLQDKIEQLVMTKQDEEIKKDDIPF